MLLIVRWFGSEFVVKMDELKSGVVVGEIVVVVDSENAVCSMLVEVSVVGSGIWVPVNVPVVQVLNLLLSEFWSLPSCALETVVVIESLFA